MKIFIKRLFLLIIISFALYPAQVYAYVGPGAGFAFISSFMIIFVSFFLALFSFLILPFKLLYRLILRIVKKVRKTDTKKVVIVGFDGMEPELTEQYMREGALPNFKKLMETGDYRRLATTNPPISPVAWSSFSTGVNPGKHNIYDFLRPDRRSYMSELSSVTIKGNDKSLSFGKYNIPLSKPKVLSEKKSKTFWRILSEHGIYSSILRVPLTYPPEKFFGTMISGMCVPDILGTQGTFTFYSSKDSLNSDYTGGQLIQVKVHDGKIDTHIPGPPNPFLKKRTQIKTGVSFHFSGKDQVEMKIGKESHILTRNEYSDWIEIPFKAFYGVTISGIARFFLKSVEPEFELYVTPIHIDPEKPAQPVGSPKIYSIYLSKLLGKFGTLGLAEDTWAVAEGIIDEQIFWDQSISLDQEHERAFFHSLKKVKKGCVACVFDLTDRVQHLFMRYLDKSHPANRGRDTEKHVDAIKNAYIVADRTLGKVMERIGPKTVLFVLSDHGFKQYKRSFNVNRWLFENGYLHLKDGKNESGEWFDGVDWDKTRAYGMGLSGLFINQKGREWGGIVQKGEEKKNLIEEIAAGLEKVTDPETGKAIIRNAYRTNSVYIGPYKENAPDILLGYYPGNRTSWDSVKGRISSTVFEDNTEPWSGDHCIDCLEVPGILLTNRKVTKNDPSLMDIAPTVLNLLGINIPGFIDGKALF